MTPEIKPYEGSKNYIFVIYSRADSEAAFELVRELAGNGFRVWYDDGTEPADGWPEVTGAHLKSCGACIAVVSPNLLNSPEGLRQITFSQSINKPLIPVFTEPADLTTGMQMLLLSNQPLYRYELDDAEFTSRLLSIKCLENSREILEICEPANVSLAADPSAPADIDVDSVTGAGVALALGGEPGQIDTASALFGNAGKKHFRTAKLKKACLVTAFVLVLAASLTAVYFLLGSANKLFFNNTDPGTRVLAKIAETTEPSKGSAGDTSEEPSGEPSEEPSPTPVPANDMFPIPAFTGLTLYEARREAQENGLTVEVPEWLTAIGEDMYYRVTSQIPVPGEPVSSGSTVSLSFGSSVISVVPTMDRYYIQTYNGHGYAIFTGSYSWAEAAVFCEKLGGHLATVSDADEQKFIDSINPRELRLWLGGYRDCLTLNSWRWITGESWEYTRWASDEPNGGCDPGAECCLVIWPRLWNDLANNNLWEQDGFVCEWEPGEIPE